MVSLRQSLARRLAAAVALTALSALCLSLAPAQSTAKTLRHGATNLSVKAPSDFRIRYQRATRTYALLSRERRIRITYSRLRTNASVASVRRLMRQPATAAGSRRLRLELRRKGPHTVAATILGYRRASERRRRALIRIQRRVTRTARGGRTRRLAAHRSRGSLSVAWRSPKSGATLSGQVKHRNSVSVKTRGEVDRVELFVDGDRTAIEADAPYSLELDTTDFRDGRHTLNARAYLESGRSAQSRVTVNVDNSRDRPVVPKPPADDPLGEGLLFEDTFDLGSGGERIWGPKQAAADSLDYVTSSAFPGRRMAMRNRLVPGDVHPGTDSARSELTGSLRFRDGDIRWFRMPVRFNQWALQSSAWALIWQAHAGSGSPPLATYVEGDKQMFHVKNGDTQDTFWKHPFELGRWYDLVIGVRFSHGGDGWVEVWLDGQQQTMANGAPRIDGATLSPRSSDSYDKLGLYQSKSFSAGERELLHGMYRVGTSRASVMR